MIMVLTTLDIWNNNSWLGLSEIRGLKLNMHFFQVSWLVLDKQKKI